MKYVTWHERFVIGDFPMVCAYSGQTATKLVPVQARRSSAWPWFFVPALFAFLLAQWVSDSDRPWGLLPFAEGQVGGVAATFDKGMGVVTLRGVHPDFVAATKAAQAEA